MQDISLQEIIRLLGPNAGYGLIYNIFIYLIFFFTLVTLLLQGDKALTTVLLCAAALLMGLVDKLAIFAPKEFGAMVLHAGMFIFPALVAGMTKDKKSRGPAVLAALFGATYFFLFWFFLQRS
jgi:hypothetical protein